ncbi:MAG: hypothetical protein ABEJ03_02670 [Candidatus Nanohaloarchaea archaeon]
MATAYSTDETALHIENQVRGEPGVPNPRRTDEVEVYGCEIVDDGPVRKDSDTCTWGEFLSLVKDIYGNPENCEVAVGRSSDDHSIYVLGNTDEEDDQPDWDAVEAVLS